MTKQGIKERLNLTNLIFILRGLLIGLVTGIVVSLFRLAIIYVLKVFIYFYQAINQNMWLLFPMILLSLAMVLGIGTLMKQEPNIMGSGIPQVEGQLAGNLEMRWWSVLWRKFIGGVLGIGSGLFLGREGPSIQLGAAVGQGFAEMTKHTESERRILIAGGGAAGLSAAFNAPIASTLFILEEVYHNFSPLIWTTALASSISANYISLHFFGLKPALQMINIQTLSLLQYWHLIVLGLILGLLGYLYQNVLLKSTDLYNILHKIPIFYRSIVPFILVIPIGLYLPQTLGGGNEIILSLVQSKSLTVLLGLFLLRFIFSMISYGSGLPGGIFLPILTLGAIIGAGYATVMIMLGLLPAKYLTDFIIFGMAGYFAGIGKAPFTAILLVTEMVGSLHHLMPLAIISLVSFLVIDILGGAPIYDSLLKKLIGQNEIDLGGKKDRLETPIFAGSNLENKKVSEVVWPENSLLITVRRGEKQLIPHGVTVLKAGDTLVLLTEHQNRPKLKTEMDTLSGFESL
ncbi:chloride channel protein [Dellaglioa sp. P0083]|uniref:ClC family H(+)/Cl(-) exchange transporter n=1 Tax=Dellaglioa kimchii TaxID=3344667 RepID=UPI0038D41707